MNRIRFESEVLNRIEFMGGNGGRARRSIVLAPIWRMDDMKATLQYIAYVRGSVHSDTVVATSTTAGLNLPWAEEWRSAILN